MKKYFTACGAESLGGRGQSSEGHLTTKMALNPVSLLSYFYRYHIPEIVFAINYKRLPVQKKIKMIILDMLSIKDQYHCIRSFYLQSMTKERSHIPQYEQSEWWPWNEIEAPCPTEPRRGQSCDDRRIVTWSHAIDQTPAIVWPLCVVHQKHLRFPEVPLWGSAPHRVYLQGERKGRGSVFRSISI